MTVIEPRGGTIIGRVPLPATAQSIVPDPRYHRMVAITPGGVSCVAGRPTFAWRFGSAVTGALAAAFVALIALRLFGSLGAAALAGLFITIDGLAFTISRIAMNDSYVMAFMLIAWFAVLTALFKWGRNIDEWGPRSRRGALGWLIVAGLFAGFALASKWVGLYAIAAIVLLVLWDLGSRRREGLLTVAGSPVASVLVLGALLGVVPLALYVASYQPYFSLGHSFHDFLQLQVQMYDYHAYLKATHPFGSRWWGWPFGHKAVFLYLADHGVTRRSEIWTIPNIVVFWGGLIGMAGAVGRARRERSVALVVLVGAALAQWLPWTIVSRVTFLYHYLPVVPFLAIALAWYLVVELRGQKYQWLIVTLVTLAAIAFFFAVLPALEGWSVPATTLDTIRRTLPWILPP
jgi:dolichyl-phosphate-mannose--protein O-mannosyl transferase